MSNQIPNDSLYQAVRTVIRRRKTSKVLGSLEQPPAIDDETLTHGDSLVRQSIDDAGWAPFHFDRHVDEIAEPWRVCLLRHSSCKYISRQLSAWFTDMKPGNKMPALLTACGCVVLVTWIPQKAAAGEDPAKLVNVNEEHLAATAAFVQNLLLLLDAGGMNTYWSSGGLLKSQLAFDKLGISRDQQLIACIFVDYAAEDSTRAVEFAGGGQREKRSPSSRWTTEIVLP